MRIEGGRSAAGKAPTIGRTGAVGLGKILRLLACSLGALAAGSGAVPVAQGETIFNNTTGANTDGGYAIGLYPGSSNVFTIGFNFSVPTGRFYTLQGGSFLASQGGGNSVANLGVWTDTTTRPMEA